MLRITRSKASAKTRSFIRSLYFVVANRFFVFRLFTKLLGDNGFACRHLSYALTRQLPDLFVYVELWFACHPYTSLPCGAGPGPALKPTGPMCYLGVVEVSELVVLVSVFTLP